MLRRPALVAAAAALAVAAGCSSGPPVRAVTVQGSLVWPPGSLPNPMSGRRATPTGGTVAFLRAGRVVARVRVANAGRFTVALDPGTYEVEGTAHGHGACTTAHPVVVGARSAPPVVVDCHFVGPSPG